MDFLSDSKSPQLSESLLWILSNVNNVVVRMVSARPTISHSSRSLTKTLESVPSAAITIGIFVDYYYHFYYQLFPSEFFSAAFTCDF